MRILIADANTTDAAATAKALRAQHEVHVAVDGEAAWKELAPGAFDVLIVDLALGRSALELVRRVRAADELRKSYVHVLVTTARAPSSEVVHAFEAGASDVVRKPLIKDELLARLGAMARLRKLLFRNEAKDGLGETAHVIQQLQAWKAVHAIFCKELSDMLGVPLSFGDETEVPEASLGAAISLTLPRERIDVQFSIYAGPHTVASLGEMLLGAAPDPSEACDLMFEMINTAAGAFKRELCKASIELTMGLPALAKPMSATRARGVAVRQGALFGPKVELAFVVAIRSHPNEFVTANQLRQGMVLVNALATSEGALLLPAGTLITSSTAERVARILGPEALVAVAIAA